ncbi:HET-domain-containing protein [Hypoxylon sp. NC1633]|nr:HET-domain-containing protein [Hypoxylon sp. NC1633]
MSTYPYHTIPTTHVRLLRPACKPSCHDSGGNLAYEFVNVPLESNPRYTALSYTWGVDEAVQCVTLNGHKVPIKKNLYAFLRRHYNFLPLSHVDEAYLWVDAICINQSDEHEKSVQLAIMGEIYKRASRIALWLGEDDGGGSDIAIGCWLRLIDKVRQGETIDLSDLPGLEIRALHNLALRDYWHRVWVWHEASTPNVPSDILCGDERIPLQDAFVVNDAIRTTLLHNLQVTETLPWIPELQTMYELVQTRSSHIRTEVLADDRPPMEDGSWNSLMSMLWATRDLQATDARDRIYALFPIYRDIRGRLPFRVRSGEPVEETYRDACVFIFRNEKDLRLLLLCNISNLPASTHSWIPNFKTLVQPFEIIGSHRLFHASGPRPPRVSVSDDRRFINLHGIRVDVVSESHLGLASPNQQVGPFDIEHWHPKFRIWFRSISKFISKGKDDRTYKGRTRLSEAADQLLALGMSPGLRLQRTGSVFHWPVFSVAAGADPPDIETVKAGFVDLFLRLGHASLFWTAHGYLGLGDQHIRAGDIVVVFYGLSVPMVVRRSALFWRIIGPCFVVGMMDGEALRLGAREEVFAIF